MDAQDDILTYARKILNEYFRYDSFTQDQEQCIRGIMSGEDVLALLPTGAGKSLCFQIPALYFQGLTIVVTPLVSLMHDQVAQLKINDLAENDTANLKKSIPAEYIDSSRRRAYRNRIFLNAARGNYKLLYVAPERLQTPSFRRFVQKVKIDLIAIDEAHCVSMWGYDFRSVYLDIIKFIKFLDKRPVVAAFTATATRSVEKDITRLLEIDLNKGRRVHGGYRKNNLSFKVQRIDNKGKKTLAVKKYLLKNEGKAGIIYCSTHADTDDLHNYLIIKGIKSAKYHSDMTSEEKKQNYEKFMSGECPVMVATNAFGMGINKRDVRFVLHYNFPKDLESYYQEAGRAGRDNGSAECILFYSSDDIRTCRAFIETAKKESEFGKEIADYRYKLAKYRLNKMIQYCNMTDRTSEELLDFIVSYFEEEEPSELKAMWNAKDEDRMIEKRLKEIKVLYYNNTKVAGEIRKQDYHPGKEKKVDVGFNRKREGKEKKETNVTYKLESENGKKLTYFDMMVADAVYTLLENDVSIIYPKTIYETLSGDSSVMLKPDRKKEIEESLDKMSRTTFVLDRSCAMEAGFVYDDEKDIREIRGKFLPIEKKGEKGYVCSEIPPLYKYAALFNGQFLTFPRERLHIKDENGNKMPSSIENLSIIYYLLYRISTMSNGLRGNKNDKRGLSRRILYGGYADELGMLDFIDNIRLEDKYAWKRKRDFLCGTEGIKLEKDGSEKEINRKGKIEEVLDYYIRIGFIAGYNRIYDADMSKGKRMKMIAGVEIQF